MTTKVDLMGVPAITVRYGAYDPSSFTLIDRRGHIIVNLSHCTREIKTVIVQALLKHYARSDGA